MEKHGKINPDMNWLRLETLIRNALKAYKNDSNLSAHAALRSISDILGDETGRGYELVTFRTPKNKERIQP